MGIADRILSKYFPKFRQQKWVVGVAMVADAALFFWGIVRPLIDTVGRYNTVKSEWPAIEAGAMAAGRMLSSFASSPPTAIAVFGAGVLFLWLDRRYGFQSSPTAHIGRTNAAEASPTARVQAAEVAATTNIEYLRKEWREIEISFDPFPNITTTETLALLLAFQNKIVKSRLVGGARHVTASIEFWKLRNEGDPLPSENEYKQIAAKDHAAIVNAGWYNGRNNGCVSSVSFEPGSVRDLIVMIKRDGGNFYALEDMTEDRPFEPPRIIRLTRGMWRVIIRLVIDGQLNALRHNFSLFIFEGENPEVVPMKEDGKLMSSADF